VITPQLPRLFRFRTHTRRLKDDVEYKQYGRVRLAQGQRLTEGERMGRAAPLAGGVSTS